MFFWTKQWSTAARVNILFCIKKYGLVYATQCDGPQTSMARTKKTGLDLKKTGLNWPKTVEGRIGSKAAKSTQLHHSTESSLCALDNLSVSTYPWPDNNSTRWKGCAGCCNQAKGSKWKIRTCCSSSCDRFPQNIVPYNQEPTGYCAWNFGLWQTGSLWRKSNAIQ